MRSVPSCARRNDISSAVGPRSAGCGALRWPSCSTVQNINLHILAILRGGEVSEATIKQDLIVRIEGSREVRRQVQVYNPDMILAVGYRVRPARGIRFRTWATTVLREYLLKGFILNDERLKNPGGFDYFEELLERIREIRASEKRFYQKLRDLFAG
jgi:hypothetical protein